MQRVFIQMSSFHYFFSLRYKNNITVVPHGDCSDFRFVFFYSLLFFFLSAQMRIGSPYSMVWLKFFSFVSFSLAFLLYYPFYSIILLFNAVSCYFAVIGVLLFHRSLAMLFFFMSKIPSINSQRNSIQQQESKGITCIHVCIDKRIVCFFFRRETEPVKFVFFFLSFIRFCFVLYFFLPCSFSLPLFDAYSLFYFTFVWQ